ncbi:MAG: bifunctional diaminohydroxyphosphoribosylaminopyrimidine deaminase/5-amino-6-(5-phosphoribosylamino)uracil reductase RibD [Bacteroidaceae bacterium]|nr:bifunctional diaminohydroxyphosphoribosylaminopyrimidine deaminase/5-amino-6-(5-phosphoribosylamino)uracil reductase RibD [Bacteroidaceae bacterium]
MRRCLQLAQCGSNEAAPNPMVGAVVVCDGRIIGEGYHQRCGEAHAEVNAIASVKEMDLLQRSTLYVSLEPCAHYGKTPPCAQLIIDKKIPEVVVGCRDPFAQVNGKGIEMLRNAGITVREGVLEQECLELNRRFITFHTLHRPYITLKWAQSKDGFIDKVRTDEHEAPVRFSTPITQALAHQLRAENEAILVGYRTVMLDNPSLTTRAWYGKHPKRVVIDPQNALPSDRRIFDNQAPTYVFGSISEALTKLHTLQVQSLVVEGGAKTLGQFIEAGLWDEARIETAPILLHNGIPAPHIDGQTVSTLSIDGRDITILRHRATPQRPS